MRYDKKPTVGHLQHLFVAAGGTAVAITVVDSRDYVDVVVGVCFDGSHKGAMQVFVVCSVERPDNSLSNCSKSWFITGQFSARYCER